jgi:hypothetical protein
VKKGPTADPTKFIDPAKMTNPIDAKDLSRVITPQR